MIAGGVVLLSFLTGFGVGMVGLVVVIISVVVVGLALRSPPETDLDTTSNTNRR